MSTPIIHRRCGPSRRESASVARCPEPGPARLVRGLRVPGFVRNVPREWCSQRTSRCANSGEWFEAFIHRVKGAKGFVPLYRISDGEFVLICGRRMPPLGAFPEGPGVWIREWLRPVLRRRNVVNFLSGSLATVTSSTAPKRGTRAAARRRPERCATPAASGRDPGGEPCGPRGSSGGRGVLRARRATGWTTTDRVASRELLSRSTSCTRVCAGPRHRP